MKFITWIALANIGRLKIVPISGAILIIIPVVARISIMHMNEMSDIAVLFINILDAKLPEMPINILRSFWISFFITLASILFNIFCPTEIKYYRDFDDWKKRSELCSRYEQQHEEEYGESRESLREKDIRKKYLAIVNEENFAYPLLRVFIAVLISCSVYLTLRIAVDQFCAVTIITNWKILFIW